MGFDPIHTKQKLNVWSFLKKERLLIGTNPDMSIDNSIGNM